MKIRVWIYYLLLTLGSCAKSMDVRSINTFDKDALCDEECKKEEEKAWNDFKGTLYKHEKVMYPKLLEGIQRLDPEVIRLLNKTKSPDDTLQNLIRGAYYRQLLVKAPTKED